MTNEEFYIGRPLGEALNKYDEDYELGCPHSFYDWLEVGWRDPNKRTGWQLGEFVDLDELLNKWEERFASPAPVTGYLLEFRNRDTGEWVASEFDDLSNTNLFELSGKIEDEWCNGEIQIGFYPEVGENTWVFSGCDWDFRCGVDFNPRVAAKNEPDRRIWGGVVDSRGNDVMYDLWRVTKITIRGFLSETAKSFFRKFPFVTWNVSANN